MRRFLDIKWRTDAQTDAQARIHKASLAIKNFLKTRGGIPFAYYE